MSRYNTWTVELFFSSVWRAPQHWYCLLDARTVTLCMSKSCIIIVVSCSWPSRMIRLACRTRVSLSPANPHPGLLRPWCTFAAIKTRTTWLNWPPTLRQLQNMPARIERCVHQWTFFQNWIIFSGILWCYKYIYIYIHFDWKWLQKSWGDLSNISAKMATLLCIK